MKRPQTQSLLMLPALLFVASIALVPISASAALNAYMTAHGDTQGDITGSVTQAGREGSMEVVEYSHSVSQSIDNASGLPTGKRQHRPIRIIKDVDKASPALMNALNSNENLSEVRIDFWRPGNSGAGQQFYRVELLNAKIINISQLSGSEDELLQKPAQETITFSYQKIIWTWQDGGNTAEDDWQTPVQ